MYTVGKLLRLCAVASGLSVAACAPSFGPGLQIGFSPGGGLNLGTSSCSFLGNAAPLSLVRGSPSIGAVEQRVQTLQAQYSLSSSDVRTQTASWKRAAEGGC